MYFLDRLKESQQFQLVNIFIQYIKNYLYIIIYSKIALSLIDNTAEQTNCSTGGRYYIIIVENGSICFVIFNLIALIYIVKQSDFARLEFFIMYGLNLGWFMIILLYSLGTLISTEYECNTVIIFRKAFLFVCIKKEIEIGALIFKQSDGFLRQVNICANTVFAFMIFTSSDQESCSSEASTIVLSITIENIVSLLFFTVINVCITCFSLKNQGFKAVRFVSIVILCSFVISYIVIMYFNATGNIPFSAYCVPIIFAMKSYTYVIPISLASMGILYYSLLLQYDQEAIEEDKAKSKNQSPISSRVGFAMSSYHAQHMQDIPNTQQIDQEGRKTVSSHAELEKLYKSGQLKNKDEIIDDLSVFQTNQGSHNLLFKQNQETSKNQFQQKEQEAPINFYDFSDKMNEKQRQQEILNKQQNQNWPNIGNQQYGQITQSQNNSINNSFHAHEPILLNKMSFNPSQQPQLQSQKQSYKQGSQGSIFQSGGITPSFNLQQKNIHTQF